ncbi:hypothetical protein ACOSP7_005919 [Xanthoceras sorbifolium]
MVYSVTAFQGCQSKKKNCWGERPVAYIFPGIHLSGNFKCKLQVCTSGIAVLSLTPETTCLESGISLSLLLHQLGICLCMLLIRLTYKIGRTSGIAIFIFGHYGTEILSA